MSNEIRKLQMVQMEILKDVSNFCKKNNLTYYLVGGTLLGSIRHQGFIPWDDDVDIAMYRTDYKNFIDTFSRENSNKYFVQNNYTDKGYSRFITKVRLNGTKQIEKNLSEVSMHHGIYIDIFPLDNVCSSDGFGLRLRGYLLKMLCRYSTLRAGNRDYNCREKDYLRKMLRVFTFFIPMAVVNKIFDYICSMSNKKKGEYTTSFASGYGWKKQLVKNEVYSRGCMVKFEGYKFNIPSKPDILLKQLYGNYMNLPPLEKRISGHVLDMVDFGAYKYLFEE